MTEKKEGVFNFNDRSQGIFAENFFDRDGAPVEDTFGYLLRARLYGRASRDWPSSKLVEMVSEYSSYEMQCIMNFAEIKNFADPQHDQQAEWREKHQQNGIAGTEELGEFLRGINCKFDPKRLQSEHLKTLVLQEDQREALNAFCAKNMHNWKAELSDLWMKGDYSKRGIDQNQAALLQQVRNQFGPEWLEKVSRFDIVKPAKKSVDNDLSM